MSDDKIVLTRKEYDSILKDIDNLRNLFLKRLDDLRLETKTKSSMPVEVKS